MSLTDRAQRFFSAPDEPDTRPDPTDVNVNLPLDSVYTMLSTWRRRAVLRELDASDDGTGVDVSDLARAVAGEECGKDEDEVSGGEYNRVYTALYQAHLQKLEQHGLVDFDRENGDVFATGQTAEAVAFLDVDSSMIAEGRANE